MTTERNLSNSDINAVDMEWVTPAEIRHIAKLPKAKGQQLLGRQLGLNIKDLDEDLRSGALLDYYYDVMQFSTSRGMSWPEVAHSIAFAQDLFRSFIHLNLPKALCALRELSTVYVQQRKLKMDNMKKLAQYFTANVLAHHSLFQLVFSEERECRTQKLKLGVELPEEPLHLSLSKTRQLWEYETRVSNVKADEQKKQAVLKKEEELAKRKMEEVEKEINQCLSEKEKDGEVDINSVADFLAALTAEEVNAAQSEVDVDIKKMKTAAEVAADFQAIPVPQEMQNSPGKVQSKPQVKVKSSTGSRKSSGKATPRKKK